MSAPPNVKFVDRTQEAGGYTWTRYPRTVGGHPYKNAMNPVHGAIIHYTAGWDLDTALSTLKRRNLSYHYIIERDGTVNMYVDPFLHGAAHAGGVHQRRVPGVSENSSPNMGTVGLSFVNVGYEDRIERPGVIAGPDWVESGGKKWQPYPVVQLEAGARVLGHFFQEKGLDPSKIWSHREMNSGGKSDPGGAFPVNSFRRRVGYWISPPIAVTAPGPVAIVAYGVRENWEIIALLALTGAVAYTGYKVYEEGAEMGLPFGVAWRTV
jgi:N-acetylmuramoyl-L-alanine amidase